MGFPLFILLLALAGVILLVVIMTYLHVYQWKINRALKSPRSHQSAMIEPRRLAMIVSVVLLLCVSFISYFAGYKAAYNDFEYSLSQSQTSSETFYAVIVKIQDNQIIVDGIEYNEEKYRGQFTLELYGETQLTCQGSPITFSDLKEGHMISVTLAAPSGTVDLSAEVITDIASIQLLSDP